MSNQILFVSVQYIRNNSVINDNVDSELIEPWIPISQDKYIEPILGTALMTRLKTAITAGSVTGNTKILLDDHVQKTLREWVIYESLPFLNFKLTNKAISKKDSDNSTPSDVSEIVYLRNNIRDTAEYYSQRLTNFLKSNVDIFPEYLNPGNDIDTIRPNNSSYFNGLYLEDNSRGDDCDFNDLGIGIPLI